MTKPNTLTAKPSSPKRRGRQRSPEADAAILQATREVILDVGYANFTVNAVVKRSELSTATIYRRWATASDRILAAMDSPIP